MKNIWIILPVSKYQVLVKEKNIQKTLAYAAIYYELFYQ
jgi:hypothetical protein